MSFTKYNPTEKQFAITVKSPSGNVVGHINLSNQFLKAVTKKQPENITTADIHAINDGDLLGYLATMSLEITNPSAIVPITNIKDY